MNAEINPFHVQPVEQQIQNDNQFDGGSSTTTGTTVKMAPLADDQDEIIDLSEVDPKALDGLSLSSVFYMVNIVFFLACLVTRKCKCVKHDSRPTINHFLQLHGQRLSVSNLLMGTVLMFTTVWLVVYNESKRQKCYKASNQSLLALIVIMFSTVICFVRFVTYTYAEGDSNKSADGKEDSQKKFDPAKSGVFIDTINILMKVCALVFVVAALCVFQFVPSSIYDLFLSFTVCIPVDMSSKTLFVIIICGVVHSCAILTETLFKDKFTIGLHFMQSILEGKHVVTMISFSGGGWLCLLFVMWLLGTYAVQCCILGQLFAALDAMWSFVICISVPNAKQSSLFV